MNTLDKVIEKYNGVHRHSIIENDVQKIYRISMYMFVYNETEFKEIESFSNVYFCECLQKEIVINLLNTKGVFKFVSFDYPICLEENKLKRIANNFYSNF